MNKSIEKYANPINEQFEGSHFHHLQDTYNTALLRVLLINEDVKRCLYGGEPETEELKKLKEMWCK